MSSEYAQIVATATELQDRGQFREALACVSQLRTQRDFPEGYVVHLHGLWEAYLHQALGEPEKASTCVDDALLAALEANHQFDPSTAWAWLESLRLPLTRDWRCEFLRGLVADTDDEAHELALDYYDSALGAFASNDVLANEFAILTMAAWSAAADCLYARAAGYLERALEFEPDSVWCLVRLGTAYGNTGREPDAIRVLERAMALDPHNQDACFALACVLRARCDFDGARDLLAHAEQLALPEGGATGDRDLASIRTLAAMIALDAAADQAVAQSAGEPSAELLRAFQAKDYVAARTALEAGADPNLCAEYFGGPLILAATSYFCDDRWMQLLLEFGAAVDVRDDSGWTALQSVANSAGPDYRTRIAECLLNAGAEVDAKNHDGGTALIYACLQGSEGAGMVEVLIGAGADPNLSTFMGSPAAFVNGLADSVLRDAIQRGIARRR